MTKLKRTFNNILREWGHDILLQRVLENGNYSNSMERVTVRSVGQGGLRNTDSRQEQDEGIVTDYDTVYYFEGKIHPKEGDRIYESYSGKSDKTYTIFKVGAVSPNRGRFGEIVFWVVGATREK